MSMSGRVRTSIDRARGGDRARALELGIRALVCTRQRLTRRFLRARRSSSAATGPRRKTLLRSPRPRPSAAALARFRSARSPTTSRGAIGKSRELRMSPMGTIARSFPSSARDRSIDRARVGGNGWGKLFCIRFRDARSRARGRARGGRRKLTDASPRLRPAQHLLQEWCLPQRHRGGPRWLEQHGELLPHRQQVRDARWPRLQRHPRHDRRQDGACAATRLGPRQQRALDATNAGAT